MRVTIFTCELTWLFDVRGCDSSQLYRVYIDLIRSIYIGDVHIGNIFIYRLYYPGGFEVKRHLLYYPVI